MRVYLLAAMAALALLTGCTDGKQNSLLITLDSPYSVEETLKRFTQAMTQKGYRAAGRIDHTVRAKKENIYLHPTVSLTLDNPKVFSALLTCNPSLAIDLPLRVVAYSQLGGSVKFAYTQPEYWSLKHNIKDKNCIAVILKMTRDFNEAVEVLKK